MIQLLDRYPIGTAFNVCYRCRAAQRTLADGRRERVVDPYISIDFEGSLMFCESCVVELAGLLGMVLPDVVEDLVAERDEALEAVIRANQRTEDAEALTAALRKFDTMSDAIPTGVDGNSIDLSEAPQFVRQANPVRAVAMDVAFVVDTAEGNRMAGDAGDWLCLDEHSGHRWPCKAGYFEHHYRPAKRQRAKTA